MHLSAVHSSLDKSAFALRPRSAVILIALLAFLPSASQADGRGHGHGEEGVWLASWGASPSDPGPGLSSQTVREHVRLSLGGDRLRVRLSNRFGTQSLVVGPVHVALQASGAAIVPGSDRAVTFSGQPTITIPPGALAVSDPVRLEVEALQEVAVSIFLPGNSGPLTIHALGVQTAYISPTGDFTSSAVLPVSTTSLSRFLLSDVEVLASDEGDAIITLGDSITDGFNSTVDANHRWPDFLAARLRAQHHQVPISVVDQGISGNRLLHDIAGPSALERFDRDVIAQPGAHWMTVLLGINDIGFPGAVPGATAVTADEIIGAHKQLIIRAHDAGLKIYGCTLTPFEGTIFPGYFTPAKEVTRETVNAFIRTSGAFDAVIDFDQAIRDPSHPTRMLPAFDSGDHLHPNDLGYQTMANAVDLRLFGKGEED
jgi:lysophospholipase L1-like esterase